MSTSGLFGPNQLTVQGIASAVSGVGPGAYVLGRSTVETFFVSYVGRSDTDLANRLNSHVGKYSHFKYGFFPSPKAAFDKECFLFHSFGETSLDNAIHPARPQGTGWTCLHCNNFD
jgi:hypothetical protein